MASIIGSLIGGAKRTYDTLVGNDSDTKDDELPSEGIRAQSNHHTSSTSPVHHSSSKRLRTRSSPHSALVASLRPPEERPRSKREDTLSNSHKKRIASPKDHSETQPASRQSHAQTSLAQEQSTSHTQIRGHQRVRPPRTSPSADERRLFQGSYPKTQGSTRITVPQDEWSSRGTMKIKSFGNVRPRNTLNQPSAGAGALATYTSRGHNVSAGSSKRQKIGHEFPEDAEDISDDGWFDRDVQGQSPVDVRRQPSVISLNSQENHSQRSNLFGHEESRDAHARLNNTKRKGRKPKIGTTQHSSPRQHGASTNPVSVDDDDDDVQVLDEQHNAPRSAFDRTGQFAPPSPPLARLFIRDDGKPDLGQENHQASSKLRSKMQSASNTSQTIRSPQLVHESSPDELSYGHTVQSSVRKAERAARSPSPNAITSTHFTKPNKRKKPEEEGGPKLIVHLSSLRMMGGSWDNLELIYSSTDECIQFTKNGEMLRYKDAIIQLSSKHATTVYHSLKGSRIVIFKGCSGDFSRGRIWFDFDSAKDRNAFLEAVHDMSPRAQYKDLDSERFEHVREHSEAFVVPVAATTDPELAAMLHRQGKPGIRERTLAAQSGSPLPEASSQVPRHRQMRSTYTNQPVAKAAQDHSLPPPKSRTEQVTPLRSSGRLRSKDSGKAAQPAEPEVERWTVKHGIPKWDAPLVYPAEGPNRTTIDAEDIARLDDGELLNDNIILFCLREMQEKNPGLKGKAHIFNSFFYETLTSMPSKKKGFNYEGVKRWTRNIDLFSHPYVAVPINTQYHWFLVIICNLDKLERKLNLDGLDEEQEEPEAGRQPTVLESTQSETTAQNEIEIPESPPDVKDEGLSQGVKRISLDGSQEQEDELPPLGKLKPTTRKGKKQAPPLPKTDPNTPALILLDSLGGTHPQEIKNLKQYVVHEGRDKRGLEFEYTALKGLTARGLPQQTNFCDCGVYLIGYMEAFVRDPAEFVRKVMSRELDRDNDFADFDPAKKRAEIREKLIKLEIEQSAAKKQRKKEKARLLKLADQDNGSVSPAPPAVQRSSPLKPAVAYADSRMVQSSPVKPPVQKTSLRKPVAYLRSRSRSPTRTLPSIEERLALDEMLFGDEDGSPDELGEGTQPHNSENYSHLAEDDKDTNDQPSTISYPQGFVNELLQVVEEASEAKD